MPREKRSEARPNQKLPGGHFDSDGLSQGRHTGAVRPTKDAHLEQREPQKQEGDRPPGPKD